MPAGEWIRNVGQPGPALVISQEPGAAAQGTPALAINQLDATGTGLVVRSAGPLLDLQSTAGVSRFKIDAAGNVVTGLQPPWAPSDNNLLAVSAGDPALLTSTSTLTAGTLYLMKLTVRTSTLITNLIYQVGTVASGASTQTFTGLYSSAGTLLTGSADVGTPFTSQGPATCALTTPQTIAAGSFVWAALVTNFAVTQPTLFKGATATGNVPNVGLTAANYRFATNGTSLTSLPGSITPSSNSAAALLSIWVGAS